MQIVNVWNWKIVKIKYNIKEVESVYWQLAHNRRLFLKLRSARPQGAVCLLYSIHICMFMCMCSPVERGTRTTLLTQLILINWRVRVRLRGRHVSSNVPSALWSVARRSGGVSLNCRNLLIKCAGISLRFVYFFLNYVHI